MPNLGPGPLKLYVFPHNWWIEPSPRRWTKSRGITVLSTKKDKPYNTTGLTPNPFINAWQSVHRILCQARIEQGPGTIRFPAALPRGRSPFIHRATNAGNVPPVPVLCHQCRYYATSAGTMPPVSLLQCRYCATSAGTVPPGPVLCHQCRYSATSASTLPPVPVLCHQCQYSATSTSTLPPVSVLCHQYQYSATSASTMPPVPVLKCTFYAAAENYDYKNCLLLRIDCEYIEWQVKDLCKVLQ